MEGRGGRREMGRTKRERSGKDDERRKESGEEKRRGADGWMDTLLLYVVRLSLQSSGGQHY
jgi:hypothetical protein